MNVLLSLLLVAAFVRKQIYIGGVVVHALGAPPMQMHALSFTDVQHPNALALWALERCALHRSCFPTVQSKGLDSWRTTSERMLLCFMIKMCSKYNASPRNDGNN